MPWYSVKIWLDGLYWGKESACAENSEQARVSVDNFVRLRYPHKQITTRVEGDDG